jgi:chromosome segregation ATPase
MVVLAILASVLFINQTTTVYNWKAVADSLKEQEKAYAAQVVRERQLNGTLKAALQDAQSSASAQLEARQLQLDQLRRELEAAQVRIASLDRTNANLETGNAGLTATVQQLTTQVGQLRKDREDREKFVETLNQQLQRADRDLKELARQVEHATDAGRTYQEQLVARDERIKDLEKRILQGGGGETAASNGAIARQAPKIEGTVTRVLPGDHLAELNVGSASGVAEGMKFILYRGADLVGTLTINQVDPGTSAGTLTYEKLAPLQGDKATTALK